MEHGRRESPGAAVASRRQAETAEGRTAAPAEAGGARAARYKILLAFGAVYVIWGSTFLGIKYAIESLPPFLMSGLRFTTAGIILYAWAAWAARKEADSPPRPSPAQWRAAAILGGLLFLGGNAGVVWAEKYIPSGLAALLIASEPFWVALLSWAVPGGKRPTGKVSLGLLIGFVGVWLLFGSGGEAGNNLLGVLLTLGAACSWAVGSVYSTRVKLPSHPALASGMQMLSGGALLLLASAATGEWTRFSPAAVSARSAWAFVYLISFGSIVAFTAYHWLLGVTTPAKAATYAYVNPAVAVLLGWAVGGEPISLRMLGAMGTIVTAVVIITSQRQSESPDKA
jgi:drug/metabolite transporter (DMT)-like permease